MDSLVFPQPAPKPLILPRRLSLHSSSRGPRHWYPGGVSPSSPDKDDSHFYYFPITYPDPQQQGLAQTQVQVQDPRMAQGTYSVPMFSSSQPPVLFSFGGDGSQDEYVTAQDSARGRPSRRHSVSNGSPWTTIPPRHALHMPVMKIDPTVWRSEHHQRDIYRLMHEGREEEVMKRRGVRSVMDTMTEEDEDDRGGNMSGVVQTADSGGFRTTDEREKELVRQQVRQEWAKLVEEQTKEYEQLLQQATVSAGTDNSRRRNSWPKHLNQHQVQLKMPSQVLHPLLAGPPPSPTSLDMSQLSHAPTQLPPPGVQQSMGPTGAMATGPLSNPAAWSAAPTYSIDTRRPSFAVYRG
ncbi:MAG: hypothetical protein J3Q66DRAFT_347090 [Benniella sp.]|nr:MAG: hypothetical protein J3Q66DRAFT_347090 [Benniella sp.]